MQHRQLDYNIRIPHHTSINVLENRVVLLHFSMVSATKINHISFLQVVYEEGSKLLVNSLVGTVMSVRRDILKKHFMLDLKSVWVSSIIPTF